MQFLWQGLEGNGQERRLPMEVEFWRGDFSFAEELAAFPACAGSCELFAGACEEAGKECL